MKYARWWHGIAGAMCIAVHISRPPIASSGKKRKGATSGDPLLFREHPPSRDGKKRGGRK